MRRLKNPIPLSIVFFLAFTFLGAFLVRGFLLRTAMRSALARGDAGLMIALARSWPSPVNLSDGEGRTPLHLAVRTADLDLARGLLASGADADAAARYGLTPLHEASYYDRAEMVRLLIAHGANVNARDAWGRTPLHVAAEIGCDNVVALLLAAGAGANVGSETNVSPLYLALYWGRAGCAKLLIKHGADVNAPGRYGRRPLHLVAEYGRRDLAELLLSRGADLAAPDDRGAMPLHVAAFEGHKDVVELFLAKGADIEAKGPDGLTPLQFATESSIVFALASTGEFMMEVMNRDDDRGRIRWRLPESRLGGDRSGTVTLLVSRGAETRVRDKDGRTPLHGAAWRGWKDAVAALIAGGAAVNARDSSGKTALAVARERLAGCDCKADVEAAIQVLVSHGAVE